MAKIKFGMMMTDARGKLGGQVFSKNRGGAYVRTKVTPSNPRTTSQQANRSLLGSLSQGWSGLTASERASYNSAVPSWVGTNIFGDSVTPSGKSLFVKLNKNLLSVDGAIMNVAPEKVEIPILGLSAGVIDISSSTATLTFSGDLNGTNIVVGATPAVSQGTSNVKSKFRRIYFADGAALSPAALYAAYVAKFGAPTAGANIQFEVKVIASNGQMSVPETIKVLVQA